MKLTCPACGYYGAIEGFVALEDYKKALAVIAALPCDLPALSVRYLGLFRKPGSDRAMTGSRVRKLVEGLKALVCSPDIAWKHKRPLENHPAYWAQAVEKLLDRDKQGKLERPLENHNLLRCIAYDIAEKDFESRIREKETRLRYRPDQAETAATADHSGNAKSLQEVMETAKRNISGWRERLGVTNDRA